MVIAFREREIVMKMVRDDIICIFSFHLRMYYVLMHVISVSVSLTFNHRGL